MSHIRLAIFLVSLISPVAASAADGGVYLYLQPLAPEAARLTFTIASISAVAADGSEHPLKVNLSTIGQQEAGRQRLLASGRLPAGPYTGLTLKIARASMKGQANEGPLTVPDGAVRVDFPFALTAQRSPLAWLTLNYAASTAGGSGFTPVFSVSVPSLPIGEHAGFVSNSSINAITVIDKNSAQAVAVIGTCAEPGGVALDRRRRRLYVACSKDDEVDAIDATTGEILERGRLSPGDRPREIALTPDGTTLVSANAGSNTVTLFDAVSLSRQERINVGTGPTSVVLDPAGKRAFVFNTYSSSISVVDIAARHLVGTMSTDGSPLRGKFNRRGDRLYVIHERSPYMTVLDPHQLTVVTRARLRIGVSAIETDVVRDLVCIGGEADGTIEFYDPNALMPLYSMKTRAGVSYMAAVPEDNTLFVVSRATRSLLIARLGDRKVVSEIDLADVPYQVAVMGGK